MSIFTNRASHAPEEARAYTAAVLDLVGERDPLEVLRGTGAALRATVDGLSDEQVVRPEAPGKWSIRHVLQHLADSELVWAFRLRMALAQDRARLTGYDQDAWAERLGYDEADPRQALQDFVLLRTLNLRLLARASGPDLERVALHAERGEESVKHMIRLYAGHDLLHLRQIDRIRGGTAGEA